MVQTDAILVKAVVGDGLTGIGRRGEDKEQTTVVQECAGAEFSHMVKAQKRVKLFGSRYIAYGKGDVMNTTRRNRAHLGYLLFKNSKP